MDKEEVIALIDKVLTQKVDHILAKVVDRAVDKAYDRLQQEAGSKKRERDEKEEMTTNMEKKEKETLQLSSFDDVAAGYTEERVAFCAKKVAEGLSGYHAEHVSSIIEYYSDKLRTLCGLPDEKLIVETAAALLRLRAIEKASNHTFFAPFAECHSFFERMKYEFEKESLAWAKANKINNLIADYDIVKDAAFIKSDVERFISNYIND